MERIRQEWASFKALSLKKKLEHIWIYYKWYILVGTAVICMLVSIARTVADNSKETLISGIFINSSTSPEGYAHLMEDYWEYCGGNEDQKVELVGSRNIDFDAESPSQEDAAAFMIVSSMIAARSLDYIITDRASLDDFQEQEVILDLRELFPAETLTRWDVIEEDGAAIALELKDTAFGKNYPLAAEDSCVLVIANAQNRENVICFLEYLMAE